MCVTNIMKGFVLILFCACTMYAYASRTHTFLSRHQLLEMALRKVQTAQDVAPHPFHLEVRYERTFWPIDVLKHTVKRLQQHYASFANVTLSVYTCPYSDDEWERGEWIRKPGETGYTWSLPRSRDWPWTDHYLYTPHDPIPAQRYPWYHRINMEPWFSNNDNNDMDIANATFCRFVQHYQYAYGCKLEDREGMFNDACIAYATSHNIGQAMDCSRYDAYVWLNTTRKESS